MKHINYYVLESVFDTDDSAIYTSKFIEIANDDSNQIMWHTTELKEDEVDIANGILHIKTRWGACICLDGMDSLFKAAGIKEIHCDHSLELIYDGSFSKMFKKIVSTGLTLRGGKIDKPIILQLTSNVVLKDVDIRPGCLVARFGSKAGYIKTSQFTGVVQGNPEAIIFSQDVPGLQIQCNLKSRIWDTLHVLPNDTLHHIIVAPEWGNEYVFVARRKDAKNKPNKDMWLSIRKKYEFESLNDDWEYVYLPGVNNKYVNAL